MTSDPAAACQFTARDYDSNEPQVKRVNPTSDGRQPWLQNVHRRNYGQVETSAQVGKATGIVAVAHGACGRVRLCCFGLGVFVGSGCDSVSDDSKPCV